MGDITACALDALAQISSCPNEHAATVLNTLLDWLAPRQDHVWKLFLYHRVLECLMQVAGETAVSTLSAHTVHTVRCSGWTTRAALNCLSRAARHAHLHVDALRQNHELPPVLQSKPSNVVQGGVQHPRCKHVMRRRMLLDIRRSGRVECVRARATDCSDGIDADDPELWKERQRQRRSRQHYSQVRRERRATLIPAWPQRRRPQTSPLCKAQVLKSHACRDIAEAGTWELICVQREECAVWHDGDEGETEGYLLFDLWDLELWSCEDMYGHRFEQSVWRFVA